MPRIIMETLDVALELPAGSSLIELEFEYFGLRTIPFGCRAGVCGACLVEVREGGDQLGIQAAEEAEFIRRLGHNPDHHRLACQCTLTGDVSLKHVPRLRRPRKTAENTTAEPAGRP
jgi:ferredoxin